MTTQVQPELAQAQVLTTQVAWEQAVIPSVELVQAQVVILAQAQAAQELVEVELALAQVLALELVELERVPDGILYKNFRQRTQT